MIKVVTATLRDGNRRQYKVSAERSDEHLFAFFLDPAAGIVDVTISEPMLREDFVQS
jgi:hypothetical protein